VIAAVVWAFRLPTSLAVECHERLHSSVELRGCGCVVSSKGGTADLAFSEVGHFKLHVGEL